MLFGITGSKLVLDLGRNIASNNDYNFLYPKSKFDIKIEGIEGEEEVRTFYFPMKTTIKQVKVILSEATKRHAAWIQLFHDSVELSDDENLSYYNFPEDVQLIMKIKETKIKKEEKTV